MEKYSIGALLECFGNITWRFEKLIESLLNERLSNVKEIAIYIYNHFQKSF